MNTNDNSRNGQRIRVRLSTYVECMYVIQSFVLHKTSYAAVKVWSVQSG